MHWTYDSHVLFTCLYEGGGGAGGGGMASEEWAKLSEEERTRHDILFYSQEPIDGLMPGILASTLVSFAAK